MAVRGYGPPDITLPQRLHAAQVAQAVVAAMRTEITQQDLQAAAASAIERMTERHNGNGATIAQQFLDADAGNALMEALAASTTGGAAPYMLQALTALADYRGSAAQLLAAGAAETIMAAIAKLSLATKAPADSARLSAAGACEAVVEALKCDRSDDRLMALSLKALTALAAAAESHSSAVALSLVEAGACEAATATLNAVLLLPASSSSKVMTQRIRLGWL
ncbi:hypothetical protein JKP88DRAFT_315497 [Tribonema minus]|uniref:Uncharacterized protein n=1 Tax=Tribonema minus TaxID=303371 RepID=A0A835Z6I2_9STRA|nr:hypothetical protein JKP88DRAFT_315497 [Tribonema minus]